MFGLETLTWDGAGAKRGRAGACGRVRVGVMDLAPLGLGDWLVPTGTSRATLTSASSPLVQCGLSGDPEGDVLV